MEMQYNVQIEFFEMLKDSFDCAKIRKLDHGGMNFRHPSESFMYRFLRMDDGSIRISRACAQYNALGPCKGGIRAIR